MYTLYAFFHLLSFLFFAQSAQQQVLISFQTHGGPVITLVQVKTLGTSAATSSKALTAFSSAFTSGNTVAFICSWYRNGGSATGCTGGDTGNTYTDDGDFTATPGGNPMGSTNSHAPVTSAQTIITGTVVGGGTAFFALAGAEYSGIVTSSALDGSVQTASGTGLSITCPAITTTNAHDVVITVAHSDSPAGIYSSPGGGFAIESQSTLASAEAVVLMDLIVTILGTYSPTVSYSAGGSGNAWVCTTYALKGS